MTTRDQNRATQGREQKQQIQLFAMAALIFEIGKERIATAAGRGDDQAHVEQGISVRRAEARSLAGGQKARLHRWRRKRLSIR